MARPGKIQHCRRKYDYVFREGDWRRSAGVTFMVNSETSRAVLGYNPVIERVITLRVNAKPVNIVIIYKIESRLAET